MNIECLVILAAIKHDQGYPEWLFDGVIVEWLWNGLGVTGE